MNKQNKKIQRSFYVELEIAEEIRFQAFHQNVSQSEIVNRAIAVLASSRNQYWSVIAMERDIALATAAWSVGRDYYTVSHFRFELLRHLPYEECARAMTEGNHPIRDEWQQIAEHGALMLRTGAYAI